MSYWDEINVVERSKCCNTDGKCVTESELTKAKDNIVETVEEYADEYTIEAAKGYAEGLQTAYEQTMNDRATTFEGEIDTRVTVVENAETAHIAEVTETLNGFNARVTTAESDITSLDGRVTNNESDITNLVSRVTNNESDITGLNTKINSIPVDIFLTDGESISNLDRATLLGSYATENPKFSLQGCCKTNTGYAFVFSGPDTSVPLKSVLVICDTDFTPITRSVINIHTNDIEYYNGNYYFPKSYPATETCVIYKLTDNELTEIDTDLTGNCARIAKFDNGFYIVTTDNFKIYKADFNLTNFTYFAKEPTNDAIKKGGTAVVYRQGATTISNEYFLVTWLRTTGTESRARIVKVDSKNYYMFDIACINEFDETEGAAIVNNNLIAFGYYDNYITRRKININSTTFTYENKVITVNTQVKLYVKKDTVNMNIWGYNGGNFTIDSNLAPPDTMQYIIRGSGSEYCCIRVYNNGDVKFVQLNGTDFTPTSAIGSCIWARK